MEVPAMRECRYSGSGCVFWAGKGRWEFWDGEGGVDSGDSRFSFWNCPTQTCKLFIWCMSKAWLPRLLQGALPRLFKLWPISSGTVCLKKPIGHQESYSKGSKKIFIYLWQTFWLPPTTECNACSISTTALVSMEIESGSQAYLSKGNIYIGDPDPFCMLCLFSVTAEKLTCPGLSFLFWSVFGDISWISMEF